MLHFAVLVLGLPWLAGAQSAAPPTQAEVDMRAQPAAFRTAVTEVGVPVVVRDSRGHTVGGLTRADFQIFDNGKPQTISRIEQLTSGSDLSHDARRFTAFLLGDVFVPPNEWESLREAALRELPAALGRADRFAIFCVSGRYSLDFADNAAKLSKMLERFRAGFRPSYAPDGPLSLLRFSPR